MLLTFLEENRMLLPPPPLENFALPWKKVCGQPCFSSTILMVNKSKT
jgi:hypothetical protein